MRKLTFILIVFISLLLFSSIVSAQFKFVPLDIISNFFNSILKILGVTSTVTTQKTIPSSGTIVYSTSCEARCKIKKYTSGTCITGTPDTNLASMPGSATRFPFPSSDWHQPSSSPPEEGGSYIQTNFIDDNVRGPSGNPSWRVEAHVPGVDTNYWRELVSGVIPVDWQTNPLKIGDYIVVKVWTRTGPSTLGKNGVIPSSVITIWDYRTDVSPYQIREHNSNVTVYSEEYGWEYACDIDGKKEDVLPQFVPMNTVATNSGTNGWVQRVLTGVVPSRILNYQGTAWSTVLPKFFRVACNAGSYRDYGQDEGTVWFADAEVYINPTCQSVETSIGQDGCSEGQTCCCS